jgi:hypothetical protein
MKGLRPEQAVLIHLMGKVGKSWIHLERTNAVAYTKYNF